MSSPDCGRGTLDLLYACYLTVFLCCWSALHMNVPADGDSKVNILVRRIKWMLFCLLMPEYVSWEAVEDMWHAQILRSEFQKIPQVRDWTLAHGFLLKMGGLALKTPNGDHFRPSVGHFLSLLKANRVEVPEITEEDVEDKGKASVFVKVIALVQILWFAISIIARATQGLPITTLELFTSAIIFCSILTYACWWNKPCDIERPFRLNTIVSIEELEKVTTERPYHRFTAPGKRIAFTDYNMDDGLAGLPKPPIIWMVCTVVVSSFGLWHLLGWNFYFNTATERFLWRFASLCCTVIPIVFVMSVSPLWRKVGNIGQLGFGLVGVMVLALYVLVRLYLLAESLAGLRTVPAGVYQSVEWSTLIPHLGR